VRIHSGSWQVAGHVCHELPPAGESLGVVFGFMLAHGGIETDARNHFQDLGENVDTMDKVAFSSDGVISQPQLIRATQPVLDPELILSKFLSWARVRWNSCVSLI
jgi:hypothetical protein